MSSYFRTLAPACRALRRRDALCGSGDSRHARAMAPPLRKAPGSSAALLLVATALFARLPVFPSVDMRRSHQMGGGGDTVLWGLHATTIAEHLRSEASWASHRATTAFVLDLLHPMLALAAGSLVALAVLSLGRRLPRRVRVRLERGVRRATIWGYGVFGVVVVLRVLLRFGLVRGPRPLLLATIGLVLSGVLAFAARGAQAGQPGRASWGRLVGRVTVAIVLGGPIIAAWLALFAALDGRHLAHVPWAWALGTALFFALAHLRAVARRRSARSKLR